ncbi:MAG: S8 family peptidase [Xanthomonadaceae bacterium]|nr:S8 family peptidase [Xanthomonadaceae bacterium]
MTADPSKPLLRVEPEPPDRRKKGKKRARPPRPEAFTAQLQTERFGPKFDRLAEVLARDSEGLSLHADPTALAPERLLVFGLRGAVENFRNAIMKVPGLDLIDEEALEGDEADKNPVVYLLIPDARALKEIESLWRRWQRGEVLKSGWTPWRNVFALLRDLRVWGPQDRVDDDDVDVLQHAIDGHADDDRLRLELELVFRRDPHGAQASEQRLLSEIAHRNGQLISRCRIDDIAYHGVLVELPVSEVRNIAARSLTGVAGIDAVMHIRPQSLASGVDIADVEQQSPDAPLHAHQLGAPILALLDGVPVARHPLLADFLSVEDYFELERDALVSQRVHGTAMASLIVHGDRNRSEPALPRRIHVVPVLSARDANGETFPDDRLMVDVIDTAIRSMRDGDRATAPDVIVVNLSLGNTRQSFHGRMSAWARLLDRLAYHHGILFVISAGNVKQAFPVQDFQTRTAFEDAQAEARSVAVLQAVAARMGKRRIIAPAESVNGVTIGACNQDDVPAPHRQAARSLIDSYPSLPMANPSSRLGPGFANAVKPDLLMPGAREHLAILASGGAAIEVKPSGPSRAAGLRVAAPPRAGDEANEGYTNGSSAAAALASRTCHRIHDALEQAYGESFLQLSARQRAVLLKALLAHTARWPEDTADLIKRTLGPSDGRQHVRQKDNIRRFLGYGMVDADAAVACADDRATFWAVGELSGDGLVRVPVPVPMAIHGKARPHTVSATLAWLTPVRAGSRTYRCVRLKLFKPDEIGTLGLDGPHGLQPGQHQGRRGTLCSQRWQGEKAPAIDEDMVLRLLVQREPDQGGSRIDEPVPFALAVTLTMPGELEIYEQVRQRLGIRPPVQPR